jgi:uncharacterized protein YjbI with pentapeptide repeats
MDASELLAEYLSGKRDFRDVDLTAVKLHAADLSGINLRNANLAGACLDWARLQRADLQTANLTKASFERANLTGANLTGADLTGASLRWANLEQINFGEVDLSGFNLKGAQLQRSNLERTILEGANLEGANLEGANLEEANLEGANLEGANLEGANLERANLKGTNLSKVTLDKTQIKEAFFERTDLAGARLKGVSLSQINLEGADLEGVDFEGANLEGANLEGANLKGAILEGANLVRANLRRTKLQMANLKEANLKEADLRGANLRKANLTGTNLEGVTLTGANLKGADLASASFLRVEITGGTAKKNLWSSEELRKLVEAGAVLGSRLAFSSSSGSSGRPQTRTDADQASSIGREEPAMRTVTDASVARSLESRPRDPPSELVETSQGVPSHSRHPAKPTTAQLILRFNTPLNPLDYFLIEAVIVSFREVRLGTDYGFVELKELSGKGIIILESSSSQHLRELVDVLRQRVWENNPEPRGDPRGSAQVSAEQTSIRSGVSQRTFSELSRLVLRVDCAEIWDIRDGEDHLIERIPFPSDPMRSLFLFLQASFAPEELRRELFFRYPLLRPHLPGSSIAQSDFAFRVIELIERHKLIERPFFVWLGGLRDRRWLEIWAIAKSFDIELPPKRVSRDR